MQTRTLIGETFFVAVSAEGGKKRMEKLRNGGIEEEAPAL
jgi:hypothetical protein